MREHSVDETFNSPSGRAPLGALMLKIERRKCHSGAGGRAAMRASRGTIALLQMHQEQRYRRGREPGNARRLSQRLRPNRLQTLARLVRQAAYRPVVDVHRQGEIVVTRAAVDLLALALPIAGGLGLHVPLQLPLLGETLVADPIRSGGVGRRGALEIVVG